jgi:hypothetical protein
MLSEIQEGFMDVKNLKKRMRELPTIPVGMVAKDNEIIEQDEDGCHFKVTKEMMVSTAVYSLSVSGPIEKRMNIVRQFEEFLSEPMSQPREINGLPGIVFTMWRASRL